MWIILNKWNAYVDDCDERQIEEDHATALKFAQEFNAEVEEKRDVNKSDFPKDVALTINASKFIYKDEHQDNN